MPGREKMIREAGEKDLYVINALISEGASGGKVLERSITELEGILGNFFVFEVEGKVVGCCSLEVYSRKLAEIRSLVVSAEFRNKGIGSQLVQRCLDEASKKDIYQVVSVTDKCDLFGKFGFKTELDEKQVMFKNLAQKI